MMATRRELTRILLRGATAPHTDVISLSSSLAQGPRASACSGPAPVESRVAQEPYDFLPLSSSISSFCLFFMRSTRDWYDEVWMILLNWVR